MPDTSFTAFTLGKYRAEALLGKGGFGTVFRAVDTTLEREVALKVLHPHLVSEPTFVERFRNEAKLIAALRHPNVVGVYELGEGNGRLFIAMEYMPGGTLKDRLAVQGRLSFVETLTILQQVCAGLEAAHIEGLIHRDIKPGNILFDKRGNAVVGDFGLARAVQLSSLASSASSTGGVGTPFYKAPELWRGKPPASPATDVYALACVAYEILSGRVLFDGDTTDVVITKHVVDGPDFGADWLPSDAPAGLSEVLQRALVMKPEERCASAQAFVEALNEQEAKSKRQEAEEQAARRRKQEAEAARHAAELAAVEAKRQQEAREVRKPQEAQAAALAAQQQREAEEKVRRETEEQSARAAHKKQEAAATATPPPPKYKGGAEGEVKKTPWGLIIGGVVVLGVLIAIVLVANSSRLALVATPDMAPTMVPITPIANTSDKDGMALHYIQAGQFAMGAANSDDGASDDEKPQHVVYLDAFWIDRTEVTNAMYAKCVAASVCSPPLSRASGTNPSYFGNIDFQNFPVINVTWNDASIYCQWAGRRLPTEAEWEKAARGVDKRIYPWGDAEPDASRLNYDGSVGDTSEVGRYPNGASPYGALDMAGNVLEWVADWYDSAYYANSPTANPTGPSRGSETYRVSRGGSLVNGAAAVRVTERTRYPPSYQSNVLSFRCAMSVQ